MNITAANMNVSSPGSHSEPIWAELYQARADYGLENLRPQQLDSLFHRMISDKDLAQLYFRHVYAVTKFINVSTISTRNRKTKSKIKLESIVEPID